MHKSKYVLLVLEKKANFQQGAKNLKRSKSFGCDVKFLQKVKNDSQGDHNGNKIDVGITDDNDGTKNTQKLPDQTTKNGRDGYINDVNILSI